MRARDDPERERGGRLGRVRSGQPEEEEEEERGHTNRHSWDPEMAAQYHAGSGSSVNHRSTSDKLERSLSAARFDGGGGRVTATTGTNNRFERLNPDAETPGDQTPRPAAVVVGGTVAGGGGGWRDGGGERGEREEEDLAEYLRVLLIQVSLPKRKSAGKGSGGHGPHSDNRGGNTKGGERESTAAMVASVNCELEWDSGSGASSSQRHQDSEETILVNGERAEIASESTDVVESLSSCLARQVGRRHSREQASTVDKTSGASAQGGSGGGGVGGDPGDVVDSGEVSRQGDDSNGVSL